MSNPDKIDPSAHLSGRHQDTYKAIFRHPVAHNLKWHDVQSLFEALGNVAEGQNGAFTVTRNGQSAILHAPKHKDVASIEDLMEIRHFLERSEEKTIPSKFEDGRHLLVVIDHHEARVYRTEMHGSVPQRIVPFDPHGFGRHLHSHEEDDGKRKPERKSYYEAVAKTLLGAEQILIFGSGAGESNAMTQLLADLKKNHPNVAARVIGSVVIDDHHTTEDQLLAKARGFYEKLK